MKLVIVESPSKAKTIEKYLKELSEDFLVRASVGHIRDLPKSNKGAIDIDAGFLPNYEIVKGKTDIIDELQKLSQEADEVYLATDPDREGEAIAWHLKEVLNLDPKKTKRVVFYEITKDSVIEAFKNPRELDMKLKEAQEARRVLDRIFGYDLSALIWKKIRYGLSAGRVQSPALRILLERERQIRNFKPEKFYIVKVALKNSKGQAEFTYKDKIKDGGVLDAIKKYSNTESWIVVNVQDKERLQKPPAPFTTSTLQQAASNFLAFSPSRTMRAAQKLYEQGYITYMRTDSQNISKQAQKEILKKIESDFGKNLAQKREYKSKAKNAQEAHEAIRPTDIFKEGAGKTSDEKKIYELIWKRTLASQMADAKIINSKIEAQPDDEKYKLKSFVAEGRKIKEKAWMQVWNYSLKDDVVLPYFQKNDKLTLVDFKADEKYTEPPKRYTEAGLIKELEKRGIGRPSTYASIIKTLKDRAYVSLEGRTLIPTDTGDVVSSFLEKNFDKYISDNFTAKLEDELDDIAKGKKKYIDVLSKFYVEFQKSLDAKKDIEKLTILEDAEDKYKCPDCGGPMVYRLSRAGKFLSCKNFPTCQGALKLDGTIQEKPKSTGRPCPVCGVGAEKENKKSPGVLVEREGRYGKFIACSNYPKCRFVENKENPDDKTDVLCPECEKGYLVRKRGRFGEFYACERYPDCKFTMKARPTGKICDLCGSLMMEGTKTIPERCSNKECPMHNPHKIKER